MVIVFVGQRHINKHAKVIINDLIQALKTLPILCEEIRLKIVFPTLENKAKTANKIYVTFYASESKIALFSTNFPYFSFHSWCGFDAS